MMAWLPRLVARVPATVHTKLLAAFLAIVALFTFVGAIGFHVLREVHRRSDELVASKSAMSRRARRGKRAARASRWAAVMVACEILADSVLLLERSELTVDTGESTRLYILRTSRRRTLPGPQEFRGEHAICFSVKDRGLVVQTIAALKEINPDSPNPHALQRRGIHPDGSKGDCPTSSSCRTRDPATSSGCEHPRRPRSDWLFDEEAVAKRHRCLTVEESLDGFPHSSKGGFQWIDADKREGGADGTFFVARLWGGRQRFLA